MTIGKELLYKLSIDYAGEHQEEGKSVPILVIRLYIRGECENRHLKYGLNMFSEGSRNFEYAAESLANKFENWAGDKYDQGKTFRKELMENNKLQERWERLKGSPVMAVRSAMVFEVEGNL